MLGSAQADQPRMLMEPLDRERAGFPATVGKLNSDGVHKTSVGGDLRAGKKVKGGIKGKGGMRGKSKKYWTKEERKVLWECYVESGGVKSGGYMKKVEERWEGKGMTVRSVPSLWSQLQEIEKKSLLSRVERSEIEKRVTDGLGRVDGGAGVADHGVEETVDFVRAGEGTEVGDEMRHDVTDLAGNDEDRVDIVDVEAFGGIGKVEGVDEASVVLEPLDSWNGAGGVRVLTDEETTVLAKLREIYDRDDLVEIPGIKAQDRRKVMKEVRLVDGLLHNLIRDSKSATEMQRLLYAGSYVVADRMGLLRPRKGKKMEKGKPWWQRRIEGNIIDWQKDLARIEEIRKATRVSKKVTNRLNRRYDLVERGCLAVSTFLKGKIQSGSAKIKAYLKGLKRTRQNNLFKNNQSQLYKELGGIPRGSNQAPHAGEAREFWERIWSVEKSHNEDASWLDEVKSKFEGVGQQEKVVLQVADVKAGIRKMANWKAPGPDGVRGFCFKKFPSLHAPLTVALQACLDSGEVPPWMVKGRTVLIQKDSAKGTVASNYRPIACLPLMWKLLTGIFAEKIYDHLKVNNLLPDEQKGCRKRSRGTKDQLLIDKAILREVKMKKRHLAMGWIDYRKAYDMVPHSWMLEMLSLVKVSGNVKGC